MWVSIISSVLAALFGKLLAWFKQNELEAAAALAEELKQYAESVQAAGAAEEEAAAAVQAHEEAQEQVTDLQDQLNAIHEWNQKNIRTKIRAKHLKRPPKEKK